MTVNEVVVLGVSVSDSVLVVVTEEGRVRDFSREGVNDGSEVALSVVDAECVTDFTLCVTCDESDVVREPVFVRDIVTVSDVLEECSSVGLVVVLLLTLRLEVTSGDSVREPLSDVVTSSEDVTEGDLLSVAVRDEEACWVGDADLVLDKDTSCV